MPTIEFLRDVTVRDGTGTSYKKGFVAEMCEASARHWVVRNAAKYIEAHAGKSVPEVASEVADAVAATAEEVNRKGRKKG